MVLGLGATLKAEIHLWSIRPTLAGQGAILKRLDDWQRVCENNLLYESLCQAYLLRAKIAFDIMELDQTEKLLLKCQNLAEAENLTAIIGLVQKEQILLDQRRKQIASLVAMDKPLTLKEQEEVFQNYLRQALDAVK